MKRSAVLIILFSLYVSHIHAAKKRVLFIGNSYIYVNDLPLMLKNVAASTNDTVEYDSHTIGGYTLQQHASHSTTITKIMAGNWDYVVLQEQSQRPAFPIHQVETDVYPSARKLDSLVRHYNPCAETIFYMTWGYKNGDASNCPNYPPICTYQGMDSLIRARYTIMADSNDAILSPVGAVRRYLRTNNPSLELYDTDGSHPSLAGTYAAACTFYSVIFRKNPLNITYTSTLNTTDASSIRAAAKKVAYDSLATWLVGTYDPKAKFTYANSGTSVNFNNQSSRASSYQWSFGDGNTSTMVSPAHTYTSHGTYNVRLIAKHCNFSDTTTMSVNTTSTGIKEIVSGVELFPNPVHDVLTVRSDLAIGKNIVLVDVKGEAVSVPVKRQNNSLLIDFSNQPKGFYFLKIELGGKEQLHKIIRQ